LEKRQNDSLGLDRRILVAGAPFSLNSKRERSTSNREGTMKIQAFHKPNSKSGIRDMISLFMVHFPHLIDFLFLLL
jgi:hypothetical protein